MPEETRVPTLTVLGRLRAAPGFPFFVLLALLTPLLVAAATRGALAWVSAPSLGLVPSSISGRVAIVDARWTRVEVGDRIRAIDGRGVASDPVAVRRALLALEPGRVRLTAVREGPAGERVFDEVAEATPYGLATRIGLWTRVVTGAALLLVGLAVFVLQPGRRMTWVFLVFSSALAVHLLVYLAWLPDVPEGIVLESLGLYLAVAAGVHLFAVFPRPLVARPRRLLALYLLPAIDALLLLPFHRDSRAFPVVLAVLRLGAVLAAVGAVASTALLVVQLRRARRDGNLLAHAQARSLLVGVLGGLVIPTFLGVVVVHELAWLIKSFLVVVFFVVVVYSIVRQNAFEVDRFTAAILGYGATSVLLGAAFASLVLTLSALLGSAVLPRSPLAGGAVTAGFFLLFGPVYRRVRRRLDRWFLREGIEVEATLEMLRGLAEAVRGPDPSRSFRVGLETAGALHADRVELWSRGGEEIRRQATTARGSADEEGLPLAADGPLARALASGSGGVGGLVDRPLDPAAQDELWQRQLALAAPILTADGLHGFVALGRKRSGTSYTTRERSFLETVASQLGIAAERSLDRSVRLGPYRLLRRLGTGGMAEVFLAEKSGPGGFELPVAMKRILPHLADDARTQAMFLDEARIAALLQHPQVVRIYGIEELRGTPFLIMEYMDGPPFSTLLAESRRRGRRLPPAVTAQLAIATFTALAYAHGATDRQGRPLRIVHRDVKPGNLLTNRHGEIKLADFGIARAELRLHQTQPGRVKGTVSYMAPEQLAGGPVDTAADVYSAAAVLYECLTGVGPHADGYPGSQPAPPSRRDLALAPGCAEALDLFFARALAADPARRFVGAAEARSHFLDALAPVAPAGAAEVASLIEELAPAGTGEVASTDLLTTGSGSTGATVRRSGDGLPPTVRG